MVVSGIHFVTENSKMEPSLNSLMLQTALSTNCRLDDSSVIYIGLAYI